MTTFQPNRIPPKAGAGNGFLNQVARYLDALGSWRTYRDLTRPEDIPKRLTEVTAAYFGVEGLGLGGFPKLTGVLGAIMAVHALEQTTGALATFSLRLLLRREPVGRYRGVVFRSSPLTPRPARALRWLIGGRLVSAEGFYFFETGRTWHSQTLTVRLGQTDRTLTHLRSYSLPYREYYFDRPVSPQTLVDLVKGDRGPTALPGFIGSVKPAQVIQAVYQNGDPPAATSGQTGPSFEQMYRAAARSQPAAVEPAGA